MKGACHPLFISILRLVLLPLYNSAACDRHARCSSFSALCTLSTVYNDVTTKATLSIAWTLHQSYSIHRLDSQISRRRVPFPIWFTTYARHDPWVATVHASCTSSSATVDPGWWWPREAMARDVAALDSSAVSVPRCVRCQPSHA